MKNGRIERIGNVDPLSLFSYWIIHSCMECMLNARTPMYIPAIVSFSVVALGAGNFLMESTYPDNIPIDPIIAYVAFVDRS